MKVAMLAEGLGKRLRQEKRVPAKPMEVVGGRLIPLAHYEDLLAT